MVRQRHSFPFANLPADVQFLILSNVDVHTLRNMTQAIPGARHLCLKYPMGVLQGATAVKGLQIRNLLLTTYSLISTIQSVDLYPKPVLDDMEKFLADNLDTEGTRKSDLFDHDPLGTLRILCEIDAEVAILVRDYADDIYMRACHRDNPGAIPPPLKLSTTEMHRLTRAFYRLKLFGVLFYNYADRFHADLEFSCPVFFARLSAFEIDELVTAYQFTLRERRYFKPPYMHIGCSFSRLKPWTNQDPFNCKTCRGLYIMHSDENNSHPRRRRPAQPFWYTLQKHCIDLHGLWADTNLCTPCPIKRWNELPAADEPNAGWSLWYDFYDCSNSGVSRKTYVNAFRILGYCFWDDERLIGWGNMFQKAWVDEEQKHGHQLGCNICLSPCDMANCPYDL